MEILAVIFWIAVTIFYIYIIYRIVAKAGFSGWWALTTLVPLLNIIMPIVFAFKPWPAVEGAAAQRSLPSGSGGSEFQAPPPPPGRTPKL